MLYKTYLDPNTVFEEEEPPVGSGFFPDPGGAGSTAPGNNNTIRTDSSSGDGTGKTLSADEIAVLISLGVISSWAAGEAILADQARGNYLDPNLVASYKVKIQQYKAQTSASNPQTKNYDFTPTKSAEESGLVHTDKVTGETWVLGPGQKPIKVLNGVVQGGDLQNLPGGVPPTSTGYERFILYDVGGDEYWLFDDLNKTWMDISDQVAGGLAQAREGLGLSGDGEAEAAPDPAVVLADARASYEAQGFKVFNNPDGTLRVEDPSGHVFTAGVTAKGELVQSAPLLDTRVTTGPQGFTTITNPSRQRFIEQSATLNDPYEGNPAMQEYIRQANAREGRSGLAPGTTRTVTLPNGQQVTLTPEQVARYAIRPNDALIELQAQTGLNLNPNDLVAILGTSIAGGGTGGYGIENAYGYGDSSVNEIVERAIANGIDPWQALVIATSTTLRDEYGKANTQAVADRLNAGQGAAPSTSTNPIEPTGGFQAGPNGVMNRFGQYVDENGNPLDSGGGGGGGGGGGAALPSYPIEGPDEYGQYWLIDPQTGTRIGRPYPTKESALAGSGIDAYRHQQRKFEYTEGGQYVEGKEGRQPVRGSGNLTNVRPEQYGDEYSASRGSSRGGNNEMPENPNKINWLSGLYDLLRPFIPVAQPPTRPSSTPPRPNIFGFAEGGDVAIGDPVNTWFQEPGMVQRRNPEFDPLGRYIEGRDRATNWWYPTPGANSSVDSFNLMLDQSLETQLRNRLRPQMWQDSQRWDERLKDYGLFGFAEGGAVSTNPMTGKPHLTLDEPAVLTGMETGKPYAVAAEAGNKEMVSPTPDGGLQFTPTNQPLSNPAPMAPPPDPLEEARKNNDWQKVAAITGEPMSKVLKDAAKARIRPRM